MCLCAETQEGAAPVTDDAAGEEADPGRGGAVGTPSSGAAGSSTGKTAPTSLNICCCDHDLPNHHHHQFSESTTGLSITTTSSP